MLSVAKTLLFLATICASYGGPLVLTARPSEKNGYRPTGDFRSRPLLWCCDAPYYLDWHAKPQPLCFEKVLGFGYPYRSASHPWFWSPNTYLLYDRLGQHHWIGELQCGWSAKNWQLDFRANGRDPLRPLRLRPPRGWTWRSTLHWQCRPDLTLMGTAATHGVGLGAIWSSQRGLRVKMRIDCIQKRFQLRMQLYFQTKGQDGVACDLLNQIDNLLSSTLVSHREGTGRAAPDAQGFSAAGSSAEQINFAHLPVSRGASAASQTSPPRESQNPPARLLPTSQFRPLNSTPTTGDRVPTICIPDGSVVRSGRSRISQAAQSFVANHSTASGQALLAAIRNPQSRRRGAVHTDQQNRMLRRPVDPSIPDPVRQENPVIANQNESLHPARVSEPQPTERIRKVMEAVIKKLHNNPSDRLLIGLRNLAESANETDARALKALLGQAALHRRERDRSTVQERSKRRRSRSAVRGGSHEFRTDRPNLEQSEENFSQINVSGSGKGLSFVNLTPVMAKKLLGAPNLDGSEEVVSGLQESGCLVLKNIEQRSVDAEPLMVVLNFPSARADYSELKRFSGLLKVTGNPVDLVLLHDGPCELDGLMSENIRRLSVISGGRVIQGTSGAYAVQIRQLCPITVGQEGVFDRADRHLKIGPSDLGNLQFGLSALNLVGSQQAVEGAVTAQVGRLLCPTRIDQLGAWLADEHLPIVWGRDPRFRMQRQACPGFQLLPSAQMATRHLQIYAPGQKLSLGHRSTLLYETADWEAFACELNGAVAGLSHLAVKAAELTIGSHDHAAHFELVGQKQPAHAKLAVHKVLIGPAATVKLDAIQVQNGSSLRLLGALQVRNELTGAIDRFEVSKKAQFAMPENALLKLVGRRVRFGKNTNSQLGHCELSYPNQSDLSSAHATFGNHPDQDGIHVEGKLVTQGSCIWVHPRLKISGMGYWSAQGDQTHLSLEEYCTDLGSQMDLQATHLTLNSHAALGHCRVRWSGGAALPSALTLAGKTVWQAINEIAVRRLHMLASGGLDCADEEKVFYIETDALTVDAKEAFGSLAKLLLKPINEQKPCQISVTGRVAAAQTILDGCIQLKNEKAAFQSLRLLPGCRLAFEEKAFTCQADVNIEPEATIDFDGHWYIESPDAANEVVGDSLQLLGRVTFESGQHQVSNRSLSVGKDAMLRVYGELNCTTTRFGVASRAMLDVGSLGLITASSDGMMVEGLSDHWVECLTLAGNIEVAQDTRRLLAQTFRLMKNSCCRIPREAFHISAEHLIFGDQAYLLPTTDDSHPATLKLSLPHTATNLVVDTVDGLKHCQVILCHNTRLRQTQWCVANLTLAAGVLLSTTAHHCHLKTKAVTLRYDAALDKEKSWYVGQNWSDGGHFSSDGNALVIGENACLDFASGRDLPSIGLNWTHLMIHPKGKLQAKHCHITAQSVCNNGELEVDKLMISSMKDHQCICLGTGQWQVKDLSLKGDIQQLPLEIGGHVNQFTLHKQAKVAVDKLLFDRLDQFCLSSCSELTVRDSQQSTSLRASKAIIIEGSFSSLSGSVCLIAPKVELIGTDLFLSQLKAEAGFLRIEADELAFKHVSVSVSEGISFKATDLSLEQTALEYQNASECCKIKASKVTFGDGVDLSKVAQMELVTSGWSVPKNGFIGQVNYLQVHYTGALDLQTLTAWLGSCRYLLCVPTAIFCDRNHQAPVRFDDSGCFETFSLEYSGGPLRADDLQRIGRMCRQLVLRLPKGLSTGGAVPLEGEASDPYPTFEPIVLPCSLEINFLKGAYDHYLPIVAKRLKLHEFSQLTLKSFGHWSATDKSANSSTETVSLQGGSFTSEPNSALVSASGTISVQTTQDQRYDGEVCTKVNFSSTAGGDVRIGQCAQLTSKRGLIAFTVEQGTLTVLGQVKSQGEMAQVALSARQIRIHESGRCLSEGEMIIHSDAPPEEQGVTLFNEGTVLAHKALLVDVSRVLNFGNGVILGGTRCLISSDLLINGSDTALIAEKTGLQLPEKKPEVTEASKKAVVRTMEQPSDSEGSAEQKNRTAAVIANLGLVAEGRSGDLFLFVDQLYNTELSRIANCTRRLLGQSIDHSVLLVFPRHFYSSQSQKIRQEILKILKTPQALKTISLPENFLSTCVENRSATLQADGNVFIVTGEFKNLDQALTLEMTNEVEIDEGKVSFVYEEGGQKLTVEACEQDSQSNEPNRTLAYLRTPNPKRYTPFYGEVSFYHSIGRLKGILATENGILDGIEGLSDDAFRRIEALFEALSTKDLQRIKALFEAPSTDAIWTIKALFEALCEALFTDEIRTTKALFKALSADGIRRIKELFSDGKTFGQKGEQRFGQIGLTGMFWEKRETPADENLQLKELVIKRPGEEEKVYRIFEKWVTIQSERFRVLAKSQKAYVQSEMGIWIRMNKMTNHSSIVPNISGHAPDAEVHIFGVDGADHPQIINEYLAKLKIKEHRKVIRKVRYQSREIGNLACAYANSVAERVLDNREHWALRIATGLGSGVFAIPSRVIGAVAQVVWTGNECLVENTILPEENRLESTDQLAFSNEEQELAQVEARREEHWETYIEKHCPPVAPRIAETLLAQARSALPPELEAALPQGCSRLRLSGLEKQEYCHFWRRAFLNLKNFFIDLPCDTGLSAKVDALIPQLSSEGFFAALSWQNQPSGPLTNGCLAHILWTLSFFPDHDTLATQLIQQAMRWPNEYGLLGFFDAQDRIHRTDENIPTASKAEECFALGWGLESPELREAWTDLLQRFPSPYQADACSKNQTNRCWSFDLPKWDHHSQWNAVLQIFFQDSDFQQVVALQQHALYCLAANGSFGCWRCQLSAVADQASRKLTSSEPRHRCRETRLQRLATMLHDGWMPALQKTCPFPPSSGEKAASDCLQLEGDSDANALLKHLWQALPEPAVTDQFAVANLPLLLDKPFARWASGVYATLSVDAFCQDCNTSLTPKTERCEMVGWQLNCDATSTCFQKALSQCIDAALREHVKDIEFFCDHDKTHKLEAPKLASVLQPPKVVNVFLKRLQANGEVEAIPNGFDQDLDNLDIFSKAEGFAHYYLHAAMLCDFKCHHYTTLVRTKGEKWRLFHDGGANTIIESSEAKQRIRDQAVFLQFRAFRVASPLKTKTPASSEIRSALPSELEAALPQGGSRLRLSSFEKQEYCRLWRRAFCNLKNFFIDLPCDAGLHAEVNALIPQLSSEGFFTALSWQDKPSDPLTNGCLAHILWTISFFPDHETLSVRLIQQAMQWPHEYGLLSIFDAQAGIYRTDENIGAASKAEECFALGWALESPKLREAWTDLLQRFPSPYQADTCSRNESSRCWSFDLPKWDHHSQWNAVLQIFFQDSDFQQLIALQQHTLYCLAANGSFGCWRCQLSAIADQASRKLTSSDPRDPCRETRLQQLATLLRDRWMPVLQKACPFPPSSGEKTAPDCSQLQEASDANALLKHLWQALPEPAVADPAAVDNLPLLLKQPFHRWASTVYTEVGIDVLCKACATSLTPKAKRCDIVGWQLNCDATSTCFQKALSQCIDAALREHVKDIEFFCDHDKTHKLEAPKLASVLQPPKVINVFLKRLQANGEVEAIPNGFDQDLDNLDIFSKAGFSTHYHLVAAMLCDFKCHHYTTLVRTKEEKWRLFHDGVANTIIESSEAKQRMRDQAVFLRFRQVSLAGLPQTNQPASSETSLESPTAVSTTVMATTAKRKRLIPLDASLAAQLQKSWVFKRCQVEFKCQSAAAESIDLFLKHPAVTGLLQVPSGLSDSMEKMYRKLIDRGHLGFLQERPVVSKALTERWAKNLRRLEQAKADFLADACQDLRQQLPTARIGGKLVEISAESGQISNSKGRIFAERLQFSLGKRGNLTNAGGSVEAGVSMMMTGDLRNAQAGQVKAQHLNLTGNFTSTDGATTSVSVFEHKGDHVVINGGQSLFVEKKAYFDVKVFDLSVPDKANAAIPRVGTEIQDKDRNTLGDWIEWEEEDSGRIKGDPTMQRTVDLASGRLGCLREQRRHMQTVARISQERLLPGSVYARAGAYVRIDASKCICHGSSAIQFVPEWAASEAVESQANSPITFSADSDTGHPLFPEGLEENIDPKAAESVLTSEESLPGPEGFPEGLNLDPGQEETRDKEESVIFCKNKFTAKTLKLHIVDQNLPIDDQNLTIQRSQTMADLRVVDQNLTMQPSQSMPAFQVRPKDPKGTLHLCTPCYLVYPRFGYEEFERSSETDRARLEISANSFITDCLSSAYEIWSSLKKQEQLLSWQTAEFVCHGAASAGGLYAITCALGISPKNLMSLLSVQIGCHYQSEHLQLLKKSKCRYLETWPSISGVKRFELRAKYAEISGLEFFVDTLDWSVEKLKCLPVVLSREESHALTARKCTAGIAFSWLPGSWIPLPSLIDLQGTAAQPCSSHQVHFQFSAADPTNDPTKPRTARALLEESQKGLIPDSKASAGCILVGTQLIAQEYLDLDIRKESYIASVQNITRRRRTNAKDEKRFTLSIPETGYHDRWKMARYIWFRFTTPEHGSQMIYELQQVEFLSGIFAMGRVVRAVFYEKNTWKGAVFLARDPKQFGATDSPIDLKVPPTCERLINSSRIAFYPLIHSHQSWCDTILRNLRIPPGMANLIWELSEVGDKHSETTHLQKLSHLAGAFCKFLVVSDQIEAIAERLDRFVSDRIEAIAEGLERLVSATNRSATDAKESKQGRIHRYLKQLAQWFSSLADSRDGAGDVSLTQVFNVLSGYRSSHTSQQVTVPHLKTRIFQGCRGKSAVLRLVRTRSELDHGGKRGGLSEDTRIRIRRCQRSGKILASGNRVFSELDHIRRQHLEQNAFQDPVAQRGMFAKIQDVIGKHFDSMYAFERKGVNIRGFQITPLGAMDFLAQMGLQWQLSSNASGRAGRIAALSCFHLLSWRVYNGTMLQGGFGGNVGFRSSPYCQKDSLAMDRILRLFSNLWLQADYTSLSEEAKLARALPFVSHAVHLKRYGEKRQLYDSSARLAHASQVVMTAQKVKQEVQSGNQAEQEAKRIKLLAQIKKLENTSESATSSTEQIPAEETDPAAAQDPENSSKPLETGISSEDILPCLGEGPRLVSPDCLKLAAEETDPAAAQDPENSSKPVKTGISSEDIRPCLGEDTSLVSLNCLQLAAAFLEHPEMLEDVWIQAKDEVLKDLRKGMEKFGFTGQECETAQAMLSSKTFDDWIPASEKARLEQAVQHEFSVGRVEQKVTQAYLDLAEPEHWPVAAGGQQGLSPERQRALVERVYQAEKANLAHSDDLKGLIELDRWCERMRLCTLPQSYPEGNFQDTLNEERRDEAEASKPTIALGYEVTPAGNESIEKPEALNVLSIANAAQELDIPGNPASTVGETQHRHKLQEAGWLYALTLGRVDDLLVVRGEPVGQPVEGAVAALEAGVETAFQLTLPRRWFEVGPWKPDLETRINRIQRTLQTTLQNKDPNVIVMLTTPDSTGMTQKFCAGSDKEAENRYQSLFEKLKEPDVKVKLASLFLVGRRQNNALKLQKVSYTAEALPSSVEPLGEIAISDSVSETTLREQIEKAGLFRIPAAMTLGSTTDSKTKNYQLVFSAQQANCEIFENNALGQQIAQNKLKNGNNSVFLAQGRLALLPEQAQGLQAPAIGGSHQDSSAVRVINAQDIQKIRDLQAQAQEEIGKHADFSYQLEAWEHFITDKRYACIVLKQVAPSAPLWKVFEYMKLRNQRKQLMRDLEKLYPGIPIFDESDRESWYSQPEAPNDRVTSTFARTKRIPPFGDYQRHIRKRVFIRFDTSDGQSGKVKQAYLDPFVGEGESLSTIDKEETANLPWTCTPMPSDLANCVQLGRLGWPSQQTIRVERCVRDYGSGISREADIITGITRSPAPEDRALLFSADDENQSAAAGPTLRVLLRNPSCGFQVVLLPEEVLERITPSLTSLETLTPERVAGRVRANLALSQSVRLPEHRESCRLLLPNGAPAQISLTFGSQDLAMGQYSSVTPESHWIQLDALIGSRPALLGAMSALREHPEVEAAHCMGRQRNVYTVQLDLQNGERRDVRFILQDHTPHIQAFKYNPISEISVFDAQIAQAYQLRSIEGYWDGMRSIQEARLSQTGSLSDSDRVQFEALRDQCAKEQAFYAQAAQSMHIAIYARSLIQYHVRHGFSQSASHFVNSAISSAYGAVQVNAIKGFTGWTVKHALLRVLAEGAAASLGATAAAAVGAGFAVWTAVNLGCTLYQAECDRRSRNQQFSALREKCPHAAVQRELDFAHYMVSEQAWSDGCSAALGCLVGAYAGNKAYSAAKSIKLEKLHMDILKGGVLTGTAMYVGAIIRLGESELPPLRTLPTPIVQTAQPPTMLSAAPRAAGYSESVNQMKGIYNFPPKHMTPSYPSTRLAPSVLAPAKAANAFSMNAFRNVCDAAALSRNFSHRGQLISRPLDALIVQSSADAHACDFSPFESLSQALYGSHRLAPVIESLDQLFPPDGPSSFSQQIVENSFRLGGAAAFETVTVRPADANFRTAPAAQTPALAVSPPKNSYPTFCGRNTGSKPGSGAGDEPAMSGGSDDEAPRFLSKRWRGKRFSQYWEKWVQRSKQYQGYLDDLRQRLVRCLASPKQLTQQQWDALQSTIQTIRQRLTEWRQDKLVGETWAKKISYIKKMNAYIHSDRADEIMNWISDTQDYLESLISHCSDSANQSARLMSHALQAKARVEFLHAYLQVVDGRLQRLERFLQPVEGLPVEEMTDYFMQGSGSDEPMSSVAAPACSTELPRDHESAMGTVDEGNVMTPTPIISDPADTSEAVSMPGPLLTNIDASSGASSGQVLARPVGLENFGNVCCASSILQCWMNDPILSEQWLRRAHQATCVSCRGSVCCLGGWLEASMVRILQARDRGVTCISREYIRDVYDALNAQFPVGAQHDAIDYWEYVVPRVPELENQFSGGYVWQQTCGHCGVSQQVSLSQPLFLRWPYAADSERVDFSTRLGLLMYERDQPIQDTCRFCRRANRMDHRMVNFVAPRALHVQIPRQQWTEADAVYQEDRSVFAPLQLELAVPRRQGIQASYRLQSAVIFFGRDNAGHYCALVRRGLEWYLCNDGQITDISLFRARELIARHAVQLTYERL